MGLHYSLCITLSAFVQHLLVEVSITNIWKVRCFVYRILATCHYIYQCVYNKQKELTHVCKQLVYHDTRPAEKIETHCSNVYNNLQHIDIYIIEYIYIGPMD